MVEREFIKRTNNIVRLLVNAAGPENYTIAARIINKQANMDCDELLNECNALIGEIKRGKMELLRLRRELDGRKEINDDNTDD